jgi:hypothetical protein
MSTTYSEYVPVVSFIQDAMRMNMFYSHLWSVWFYHTRPRYLITAGVLEEIY